MGITSKVIVRISLDTLIGAVLLFSIPPVAYTIVAYRPEPTELATMVLGAAIAMSTAAWLGVDALLASRELKRKPNR